MINTNDLPRFADRLLLTAGALFLLASAAFAQPGPPPPPENPITPRKTLLGKILFWDEQLSSDNTIACGTCHLPEFGGGDPRTVGTPGLDGILGTDDDVFGSPGVPASDADNRYIPHPDFEFQPQVTGRISPSFIGASFFGVLFWDGRAGSEFIDPQTGAVSIVSGGALENQVVGPPVSDVEMAHQSRDWSEIVTKLETVIPLKLATNLPPDVEEHLNGLPSYPALFFAAFGDPVITSERIAFAIATYERTLIPGLTPFDRFVAGDQLALTARQRTGLTSFNSVGNCLSCHAGFSFSDGNFHNIGVRPIAEDPGRQAISGNPDDAGRFRTPSLRNVGLRPRYFHNGRFSSLTEVVEFYDRGGDFSANRSELIEPLNLTAAQREAIVDFLQNGLTDPRVRFGFPPFDRPTLGSELPPSPEIYGDTSQGSGGTAPLMLALTPPSIPNPDFRLGVGRGLGGARAFLVISGLPTPDGTVFRDIPLNVSLDRQRLVRTLTLDGVGPGQGFGTFKGNIPNDPRLIGRDYYAQWFVEDPAATGGFAASAGAKLELY